MNNRHFDVIVIGAGPGGSTAATLLAQKGLSVALVEKEPSAKFKIGESLLPYSMDILKESGVFETIDSGKYIKKYGASFIDYREEEQVHFAFEHGLDSNHPYAFEVPRQMFDQDLLKHAQKSGVEVLQPFNVREINMSKNSAEIKSDKITLTCDYLVDASGRKALLGSQLQNREKNPHFISNMAAYAHFKNVKRMGTKKEGDILVGILPENSWSWHIPFKGDITSVGIVCNPKTYHNCEDKKNFITQQLKCHSLYDEIMENAEPIDEITIASNYSYSSREKIGDRWIMVGDAATFLDPVFSSGVHLSLVSAKLSSEVIFDAFSKKLNLSSTPLGKAYPEKMQLGVDRFQSLLLLFYNTRFTAQMRNAISKKNLFRSFTSALGGDMWNEDNLLFRMGILAKGSTFNEKPRSL